MTVDPLGPALTVPANASRFFDSPIEARAQPTATVRLAWDTTDPYVRNPEFAPGLIAHDESYCTSVVDLDRIVQLPTLTYFDDRVLPHAPAGARVVDIGCGQGEFVDALRARRVDAIGYDPVLRAPAPHLVPRYWDPAEPGGDVFVMRCVLPHIADPWEFVAAVGRHHPDALLLVEFQRLEWILGEGIWYQLSHDHVNTFSVDDFTRRLDVVDHDTFANGEWAWVLVRPATLRPAKPQPCAHSDTLAALFSAREAVLRAARELDRPLVVWGAAGKGIVLAHALLGTGARVVGAIDADPCRHGKYMDVSGVRIGDPDSVLAELPADSLILVCNPNHVAAVQARVAGRFDVARPADLAGC